jgi:hypothetical protein
MNEMVIIAGECRGSRCLLAMDVKMKRKVDELLSFEEFRQYATQSRKGTLEGDSPRPARRTPVLAKAVLLPIDGKSVGRPMEIFVNELHGNVIRLKSPNRLDIGQYFCIRLEMSLLEAAWVQCVVRKWELAADGICEVEAEFVRLRCPHACNCPVIIFIRDGKKVDCPHAGHSGCLQTGPAGPAIKEMLGS